MGGDGEKKRGWVCEETEEMRGKQRREREEQGEGVKRREFHLFIVIDYKEYI